MKILQLTIADGVGDHSRRQRFADDAPNRYASALVQRAAAHRVDELAQCESMRADQRSLAGLPHNFVGGCAIFGDDQELLAGLVATDELPSLRLYLAVIKQTPGRRWVLQVPEYTEGAR